MNNVNRPKLHIPRTKSEWIADIIGYVALAVMGFLLVLNWGKLPDEIPAHFGASGEVDRWGSKMELLILPVITILMHIFLSVIEKRPHTHNYPSRLNESNAEAFYTNSRQTVNYMKNIINVLFAYIVYTTVNISLGSAVKLDWPFFAIIAILLLVIGWKMVKTMKIK